MNNLSVIMGVYNIGKKQKIFEFAINSILFQTYKDFKLIICDDGSTDQTFEILQKIKEKDNRIKLVKNKKNEGLASALNECIRYADSKYIARMDADDISKADRFQKQVDFLEKNKEFSIVGSSVELINNRGVWGKRQMVEYPQKENFLFGTPFVHPSVMFRKEMIDNLNGYFVSKNTIRAEDYELFMRAYAKSYRGCNLQEFLLQYREDASTYERRKYKYRLQEAQIRYWGFKRLDLYPKGWIYVIKPLIVGLVPQYILSYLRNERDK